MLPAVILFARHFPIWAQLGVLAVSVLLSWRWGTTTTTRHRATISRLDSKPISANWSVLDQEKRVERAVTYLKDMLGAGPFVAGSAFTLGDICVNTALGIWRGALGHTLPEALVSYRELQLRALVQGGKEQFAG